MDLACVAEVETALGRSNVIRFLSRKTNINSHFGKFILLF
jgi:hypothetical protein